MKFDFAKIDAVVFAVNEQINLGQAPLAPACRDLAGRKASADRPGVPSDAGIRILEISV